MALPEYTPDQRRKLAEAAEIDDQYAYQILRGIRKASASLARKLNAIDPALTLRDLRPDDWHLIWPELAAQEAA